jgi:hypothetical protein
MTTDPRDRPRLMEHLGRCRDLLATMRDPEARKTIEALITYWGAKLAAMDGPSARN